MLNAIILNTGQLNSGTPLPFALTATSYDDIEFNGYSLQDATIISSDVLAYSGPRRQLITFDIPRADGGGWNGDYFRRREITVSGIIRESSREALEDTLDEFKRAMCRGQGVFTLKVNDEVRQIIATLQNPEEMFARRQGYHITFAPFDLTFLSLEPMWHSLDYSSVGFEGITDLSFPGEIVVEGTYKAKPVIVIVIDAASGLTGVTFENLTNGNAMTIAAVLVAGDVVRIDSEQKSVTVNGVEVDYDGIFPDLETSNNSFTIDFAGTSVNYTATVKYRKTYL